MSVRGRVQFIGVVGGAVLGFFGYQEMRLARAAKADPQTLTCKELSEKGPGDNAHVRMTDAYLVLRSFAIQTKEKDGPDASTWEKAWIPAVPADGDYAARVRAADPDEPIAPPTTFRVLVQTGKGSDASLASLEDRPAIEGTVINEIDSIDSKIEKILRESYPGVDVNRCWILEMGRTPLGTGPATAMLAGGAAVILGSILWWRSGKRRQKAQAAAVQERVPAGG
jgi:hypothetical protein